MRHLLPLILISILLGGCEPSQSDLPLTTQSQEARERFREGLEHFNHQKITLARAAFEKSVAADPDLAAARGYLALSMNYTGDVEAQWKAAEASIGQATELEQTAFESHRAWGRGDYGAARDLMAKVIEKAPQSRQARFELGWYQYKLRDYGAADEALSQALSIDGSFLPAEVLLARSRIGAKDFDGAEDAIQRALELDPTSAPALTVQGDIFRNRGKTDEAIDAYELALATEADFVPALDGRAASLRIAARYEAAVAAYRDLCDATQKLSDGAYKELYLDWIKAEDVCFDYGMTYLVAGDLERTAQVFEATADYTYETRIENAPIFYNALARFYLEQGQLDLAKATYDRSLEASRDAKPSPFMRKLWDGRHVHAQARIAARQGRFDEALGLAEQMKTMIDQEGEQAQRFLPSYHYLMGYVLLEQKAYAGAVEHLEKSRLGDPFNRWLLARGHDGSGNKQEARGIAEELDALAPGSYGHALVFAEVKQWLETNAPSRTSDSPEAMKRLPDDEAGELVRRAIRYTSGDWSEWQAKKSVSYLKTTQHFAPDGSIERTASERHQYILHPALKVRIEREVDGKRVVLINNGEQAWKYVDGVLADDQAGRDQGWNSTFGSHYVFCMPFKLTDPGAIFTRVGEKELPDGTMADELVVDYAQGAGSSGGYHTWTYYFSRDDARLLANNLDYGPEPLDQFFSTYLDHQTIDGLRIPTRRIGWGYDEQGAMSAKQTEITYSDVRFNVPLSDELFQPLH